jgi:hypothetical protein
MEEMLFFGLADERKGLELEPSSERQFCSLHDLASREGGLMAAAAALLVLEPVATDLALLMAFAARTAEPIGPAGFLNDVLAFLLCVVEPLELRQESPF